MTFSIPPLSLAGATGPETRSATAVRQSFGALLERRAAGGPPLLPAEALPSALELARGIEQAQHRLDAALQAARGGRTFTPRELLWLQAQAYRYSQTMEIASRVVEQGVQSVRQAVNTQV